MSDWVALRTVPPEPLPSSGADACESFLAAMRVAASVKLMRRASSMGTPHSTRDMNSDVYG